MLWAEVYNADGSRVDEATGPVRLLSATVNRVLDGAGSFALEALLMDDNALMQLQSQRRVYIYTDVPKLRLIGAGIIARLSKRMGANGWTLAADGPDLMYELKFYNTLLNLQFNSEPAADVLEALTAMATHWDIHNESDLDVDVTARFDGSSILKAMQAICEQTGLHIRYVQGRILEGGYFGQDSGVTLINPDSSNADSPYTALIDSLSVVEESEDITNWIVPIGSGEGEASLTLRYASGDALLARRTLVANGKEIYYLANDESIALYGERRKVVKFDVSPLSNTAPAKVLASHQLWQVGEEYLSKNASPQVTYGVSVRKLEMVVLPGDKVRLLYLGPIRRDDGTEVPGERIDEMLWIIKIEERHSQDDVTWRFEVSNIDRQLQTETDIVLNEIEDAKVRKLKPGTQPTAFTTTLHDVCSPYRPAAFYLNIDSSITEIISVKLRLRTAQLVSPVYFDYDNAITDLRARFMPDVSQRYPLINAFFTDELAFIEQFVTGEGSRSAEYTVEVDVTDYITVHQPTAIGFKFIVYDSEESLSGADIATVTPSNLAQFAGPFNTGGGLIYATFTVLAVTQAIS